jgi:hypothetical protein
MTALFTNDFCWGAPHQLSISKHKCLSGIHVKVGGKPLVGCMAYLAGMLVAQFVTGLTTGLGRTRGPTNHQQRVPGLGAGHCKSSLDLLLIVPFLQVPKALQWKYCSRFLQKIHCVNISLDHQMVL